MYYTRILGAMEGLKQMILVIGGNADTAIANYNYSLILLTVEFKIYGITLG